MPTIIRCTPFQRIRVSGMDGWPTFKDKHLCMYGLISWPWPRGTHVYVVCIAVSAESGFSSFIVHLLYTQIPHLHPLFTYGREELVRVGVNLIRELFCDSCGLSCAWCVYIRMMQVGKVRDWESGIRSARCDVDSVSVHHDEERLFWIKLACFIEPD